jgi:two-component system CheB/CheR fusion protein
MSKPRKRSVPGTPKRIAKRGKTRQRASQPNRQRSSARASAKKKVDGAPSVESASEKDAADAAPSAARATPGLAIVGIGASAGGLEALEAFVGEITPDSGMAYVVVTHQGIGTTSLLPELLAKHSRVPVSVARDGLRMTANHVYVAPPGACLTVDGRTLLIESAQKSKPSLPIDHLFRSLARTAGERAMGVVLSGMGSDGTLGIAEIKGASGMVAAQAPQSARFDAMPSSAIATGLVDYVLPAREIPQALLTYERRHFSVSPPDTVAKVDPGPPALRRVLAILRNRTGNDFTAYKENTVRRRIERRMAVRSVASVQEYVELLERAPYEVDALFRELLISVTSFFRDPDAFQELERQLGRLIAEKPENTALRIWVPGCATGEEAYSIAILVKELLAAADRTLHVQIFASDLDGQAVDFARIGQYPEGIAADISAERLERFFTKEGNGYRVSKSLRELLVFAPQNLIKDPPFTKLDLISCRNVLIYLETELQRRMLGLFSYSLRPNGLLFLGTSESVASHDVAFVALDKKWRVFERRGANSSRIPDLPTAATGSAGRPTHHDPVRPDTGRAVSAIAERVLLSSFAPPSVIISERGELIFVHGRTGPFLEPAPGEPTNNVFHMARQGLRLELPAAVRQAAASEGPVVRRGLQAKTDGGYISVRLTVRRLREPEALRGAFIVTFEHEPDQPNRGKGRGPARQRKEVDPTVALEEELQRTRESLQGTIEELETTNEELKSMNEELQSTNEELQSANEELETSREEMQSLNEELQTVNSELEERNRTLSQVNDDMQNLLNSTDIATLFLDDTLAIRRFTTPAKKVFSLIDADVGRPISDLSTNLRYEGLVDEAREVLRSLVFRERELQTKDGAWRLMRVMPYQTHDNRIDGLVITFVDIDAIKRAEEDAQAARVYAESIVETVRIPLLALDERLRVVSANRAFYASFSPAGRSVEGELLSAVGDGRWNGPQLSSAVARALERKEPLTDLRVHVDGGQAEARELRVTARPMAMPSGKPPHVLLAIEVLSADGRSSAPKEAD